MLNTISNKIAVAALAVTMTVVLTLGVFSYIFARWNVTLQVNERLTFEASIIRSGLESLLTELDNSAENVSENLIVVNAVIDSRGRDIYIEPFIKSYKLPTDLPFALTLCDFEGVPFAQSNEKHIFFPDESMRRLVIEAEHALADIRDTRNGKELIIAYPVFYEATGMAEGMLIMEVPFADIIEAALGPSFEARGRVLEITGHDGKIWDSSKKSDEKSDVKSDVKPDVKPGEKTDEKPDEKSDEKSGEKMQSLFFLLKLEKPLAGLELTLEYGQPTAEIDNALRRLTGVHLGIGLIALFITLLLSRYIARRITFPLMTLAKTADEVATTGMPDARIDIASHDEVKTLACSFNTMLEKLQESRLNLERRVEQRTAELAEANKKLRTYADTQNVLLREVNHRVKNNLTAIISMLHKEEDRARDEGLAEFVSRLQEVISRISGLLAAHSLLSSSHWTPLLLSSLCNSIIHAALRGVPTPKAFTLEVSAVEDARVNSDQAHYLAIVLSELATNSMKYAMRGETSARIRVEISRRSDFLELIYSDDGPGYPESVLAGEFAKSSVGIPLIFGIIKRSLRGNIKLSNEHGARARISFPRTSLNRE